MHLPSYKEAKIRGKKTYDREVYKTRAKYKDIYKSKKYFLKTYGCQMNEHDSENIEALLEELGLIKVLDYNDADILLLNTCSIRENAHNKAYGMLGRFKHLKETKKDIVIGLCGCMAQEEGVINDLLNTYKYVDFVFGTNNLEQLPSLLYKTITTKERVIEVNSITNTIVEDIPIKRSNTYKAYVNIIYGCDKFCTYCIVPFTRGEQRSRKKEDIINEIVDLVSKGYKEVTLLGQNVNAYGKDLYDDYGLGELLEEVANTNIPRVRFMTSHPWDFTERMIDIISKYKNIMPSIHLPVQSGSNKVLKLMGRRYTKESYLELVKQIKEKIPNVSLSTDIIVGFPNERKEDFNETLALVNLVKYDNAYTFIYSKRENTPAAKLEDNIPKEEKERRLYKLNEVVNKYFKENNLLLLNKTVKVLTEGTSSKSNNYFGYTESNKLVNFTGNNINIGDIVNVKITNAKTWSLDGEVNE